MNSELDVETGGFIISCFTYGNINYINGFINQLFSKTGKSIHEFVCNFNKNKDLEIIKGIKYRFSDENDIIFLFDRLQDIFKEYGRMKHIFLDLYKRNGNSIRDTLIGLTSFFKRIDGKFSHLIPDASRNSPCKRLNLFLRWMVRKDNIDLGLWKNDIKTSDLIIPVDTHIHKVSRMLGLIDRKSVNMRFAIELTNNLKKFDPSDPVKYDFALCHIDIKKKPL